MNDSFCTCFEIKRLSNLCVCLIFFFYCSKANIKEALNTVKSQYKANLPGGGGGDSHIKRGGLLVVSIGGVNFGFWSHLGCSGQNAIICSRVGLL